MTKRASRPPNPSNIAAISQLPIVTRVVVEDWPKGKSTQLRVQLVGNGLGQISHVPVVVVRGARMGPTVGITAAIHGDELNGMHIIHRLLKELDPKKLRGSIVAVPVANVPGYLREQRRYLDDYDLNRVMPGRENGPPSEVYAHRFLDRVTSPFEYLIDLHTASAGRANSYYVRADLRNETVAWMANLQFAQIILHSEASDGTLRHACMMRGIPSVTVEVGNPQRHQRKLVLRGTEGIFNVLGKLGMVDHETVIPKKLPVVCRSSSWMYTQAGGVLNVWPELAARVKKGDKVADVLDVYGNLVEEYASPRDGIVIGKSINPVNPTGSRIVHIGNVASRPEVKKLFPSMKRELLELHNE